MSAWCFPSWRCFLVKKFLLCDLSHTLMRESGEFWRNCGAEWTVHGNCCWNPVTDRWTCGKKWFFSTKTKHMITYNESLIFQTFLDNASGKESSLSHKWIAWWQWATAPRTDAWESRDVATMVLLHMLKMASRLRLQQKELWSLSTGEMLESQKQTNSR